MSNAVLLTGGTGFLGSQIAAQLLMQTEKTIYVLVRAKDEAAAAARLKAAWKDNSELYAAVGSRILPVAGDLAAADLGLMADMADSPVDRVGLVIHAAADVGVTKSREALMQANKTGTENLYIADAALIPKAMGNPPILTILALSKRIAGIIRQQ